MIFTRAYINACSKKRSRTLRPSYIVRRRTTTDARRQSDSTHFRIARITSSSDIRRNVTGRVAVHRITTPSRSQFKSSGRPGQSFRVASPVFFFFYFEIVKKFFFFLPLLQNSRSLCPPRVLVKRARFRVFFLFHRNSFFFFFVFFFFSLSLSRRCVRRTAACHTPTTPYTARTPVRWCVCVCVGPFVVHGLRRYAQRLCPVGNRLQQTAGRRPSVCARARTYQQATQKERFTIVYI